MAQSVESGLWVEGVAATPVKVSVSALERLPQRVDAFAVKPGEAGVKFRCTRLSDVLAYAGLPMGTALRGNRLAESVKVQARDGYEVVFAIAELDEQFREPTPLLCFEREGRAMADDEGPFRVIVADDKKRGRWVRQVERIILRK